MAEPDLTKYRPNVAAAVFNAEGRVFIAKRIRETPRPWQMPQGGMDPGESPEAAVIRELAEEAGMTARMLEPLDAIDRWLVYDFPPQLRASRPIRGADWHGQKQRWFAFRFMGRDDDIDLNAHEKPEFNAWRWERLDATPSLIVPFKRPVYETVASEFAPYARPTSG